MYRYSTIYGISIFFITVLIFSVLINGLFLRFSKSLGIRNKNDMVIRWGPQSKPAFGGISFYIGFLISTLATAFLFANIEFIRTYSFVAILFVCTLAFLLGLFDDAYNTRPRIKFATQVLCSVILIVSGIYIHLFTNQWLNYIITSIWVVGLMNSVNMLDNMDGITTIVSIIILATISVILILQQSFISPLFIIILGVIASLLGFLKFNWNPSKMYMGDTGSMFIGVFLAIVGIQFLWNGVDYLGHAINLKQLLSAVLVFILPLTDTTTVTIKRLLRKSSPFIGGRDHTTHHLSYLLGSDKKVAYVFILIAVVSSSIAIWLTNFVTDLSLGIIIGVIAYIIVVFGSLFTVAQLNKQNS